MIIVYASKTGFTKRYAEMLAAKTGLTAYALKDYAKLKTDEEVIFLSWMRIGKIQGLNKVPKQKRLAVCASGTGRTAEPSEEEVITRNKLQGIPFFYLRGGCFPIKELKGFDGIMMRMFVKALKKRQPREERIDEAIDIIENGFDGVKEENLEPVITWLETRMGIETITTK